MTESGHAGSSRVNRTSYGVLALAWAAFVAYGSVVPFVINHVSLAAGTRHFVLTLRDQVFIDSNIDFVTNILLTVPLGYLVMAVLRTDRRGRWADLAASLLTVPLCFVYSVAVEFSQEFFSGRTPSASDMVAQWGGAIVGVILWQIVGREVTNWLRDALNERERPAMIQRLLLAYCVLFVISQVMPLDLTLNPGQLARKFRRGYVLLVPFSYPYPNTFERWWDWCGDAVTNIPMGAAGVLLWTHGRQRRTPGRAMLGAVAAIGAVELAQVFVDSRVADTTDVITGSLGAWVGVSLASRLSGRELAAPSRASLRAYACLGVVVWSLLLAAYHWNPFDFTRDPERIAVGLHTLLAIPFSSYYETMQFNALTQLLRKSLLSLPLGVLLHLSFPRSLAAHRRLATVLIALISLSILSVIEIGQVFLPSRVADMTDIMVGECGVLAGAWIVARLLGARRVAREPGDLSEPAAVGYEEGPRPRSALTDGTLENAVQRRSL